MKLVLTDVADNGMKRWARLYGFDAGWNIDENCIREILASPEDDPTLFSEISNFFSQCRYNEDGIEYCMLIKDGDVYMKKEQT